MNSYIWNSKFATTNTYICTTPNNRRKVELFILKKKRRMEYANILVKMEVFSFL